ncbi:putative flavoprotein YhiN [Pseudomonas nitritireducens]|uniref:Putative flavoprotein YhiN n=1 Tax=Pseudomonas nitroreducens TaxID=46680 RepID=A0A7W7KFW9_PSENT|nr:hypothetical protein [Pseudomonas nitritireducens]MBB4861579.1 putative flavoprotein YhiN [Pseudomonas nitritireducens]
MVIHGITITPEQIAAGLERMKQGEFTTRDIEKTLINLGVPEKVEVEGKILPKECANRVADRLLQRERKAGNLVFKNKVWRWKA